MVVNAVAFAIVVEVAAYCDICVTARVANNAIANNVENFNNIELLF